MVCDDWQKNRDGGVGMNMIYTRSIRTAAVDHLSVFFWFSWGFLFMVRYTCASAVFRFRLVSWNLLGGLSGGGGGKGGKLRTFFPPGESFFLFGCFCLWGGGWCGGGGGGGGGGGQGG